MKISHVRSHDAHQKLPIKTDRKALAKGLCHKDEFATDCSMAAALSFADARGINSEKNSREENVDMHAYQKLSSHADDTKLRADIYFTDAGIQRLRGMNQSEMVTAFIKTRAQSDPDVKQMPLFSADRTTRFRARFYLERYKLMRHQVHHGRMKSLKHQYAHEFGGNLRSDFHALRKAEHFAKLSRYWLDTEQTPDSGGRFFTTLGKSKRSQYTQMIPTLVQLAGRDNVLINTLSASGGE